MPAEGIHSAGAFIFRRGISGTELKKLPISEDEGEEKFRNFHDFRENH